MLKHYLHYLVKSYDQYKFGEALGFIFIFAMCLIIKMYLIRHFIFKVGHMRVCDSVLRFLRGYCVHYFQKEKAARK